MTKQEKGRGRFGDVLKVHTNFEGRQTVSIAEIMFRNLDKEKFKSDYLLANILPRSNKKRVQKSHN